MKAHGILILFLLFKASNQLDCFGQDSCIHEDVALHNIGSRSLQETTLIYDDTTTTKESVTEYFTTTREDLAEFTTEQAFVANNEGSEIVASPMDFCFTLSIYKGHVMQSKRGCVKGLDKDDACNILKHKYGDNAVCDLCNEDHCNKNFGNRINISVVLLMVSLIVGITL